MMPKAKPIAQPYKMAPLSPGVYLDKSQVYAKIQELKYLPYSTRSL